MISRLTNKTRAWNKISNNRLNQILNQTKLKTMLKFCLCSSQGKSSPCPSGSPFVPSTSSSPVIPSTSSSSEASATSEGVGSGHRQHCVFCLRCGLDPLTPRTFLWWSLHPLTPLTTIPVTDDMTLLDLSQTPTPVTPQHLCHRTWNVDHKYSLSQENHVDNQILI